jgi:hypothetical protein
MELGLIPGSLAVARDPTNLSDFGDSVYHFKISTPVAYRGTTEVARGSSDLVPGDARFDRGARYGILWAFDRLTLFCRMPGAYLPVKLLEIEAKFPEPPRFVVNLYGQTHHVRLVNP